MLVRIFIAVLFFGLLSGCEQKRTILSDNDTNKLLPYADKYIIAKSEIGDVVDTIPARGTFEAAEQVIVGSEVSGKVIKVYVNSDDKVTKGQVLAELDPEPFVASLTQARSDIRISEATIRSLQAELKKKQKQLARRSKTKDYLDEPLEVIDNLKYDIEALQARIDGAKARLEKDKANLRVRKFNLGRTKITSPIDGVVLKKNIREGANINASFKSPELFVIVSDNKNMYIEALVSELDIARLKPGTTVRIMVPSLPKIKTLAKLHSIESAPVKKGNFVNYKTIIHPVIPWPPNIKPGMSANIIIGNQEMRNISRIPIGALYIVPREYTPDIKKLGFSEDDIPSYFLKTEAGKRGALAGLEIGYYLRKNKRRIFIIKDGKIESRGIRILGESEDYVAYDEKDLPIGTPVIVGKKNQ